MLARLSRCNAVALRPGLRSFADLASVSRSAASVVPQAPGAVHPSAKDVLSEQGLQSVLSEHSCDAVAPLPTDAARLAVVAHLTTRWRVPMPSKAFASMNSAQDAAEWYALALRPRMPDMHIRKVVAEALNTGVDSVEDTIALNGGQFPDKIVQQALPENLHLDARTFEVLPVIPITTAKRKPNWIKFKKDSKQRRTP